MADNTNVLVVDDSAAMRQLLKMLITRHVGCRVSCANDGMEAVQLLRDGGYDLLVTDINMPRMSGLELIEEVRSDLSRELPIIIVTTMGAEDDRDRGLELGANAYVTKPVDGARLINAINSLTSAPLPA